MSRISLPVHSRWRKAEADAKITKHLAELHVRNRDDACVSRSFVQAARLLVNAPRGCSTLLTLWLSISPNSSLGTSSLKMPRYAITIRNALTPKASTPPSSKTLLFAAH